jgi:hypothetical protein
LNDAKKKSRVNPKHRIVLGLIPQRQFGQDCILMFFRQAVIISSKQNYLFSHESPQAVGARRLFPPTPNFGPHPQLVKLQSAVTR